MSRSDKALFKGKLQNVVWSCDSFNDLQLRSFFIIAACSFVLFFISHFLVG